MNELSQADEQCNDVCVRILIGVSEAEINPASCFFDMVVVFFSGCRARTQKNLRMACNAR